MNVLINPNPELRKKSTPIDADEFGSDDLQKLIVELKQTMATENGVGIAAPQIGVHKRVIIVDAGNGPQTFINPVITRKSFFKIEGEEGCLSVPGVFGIVRRSRTVTIEAFDEQFNPVTIRATQFPARVFQHEIDHLDGILFIDKVIRFTAHPKI